LAYCAGTEEGETPRAEAIKANFAKLVSEDKEVKREALLYFGKVDKTFAAEIPLFTASLKDERNQVRAISAYALGKIGEAAAGSIPEVEKLLTDSSATVQKYAKRALERLGPFRPVPQKPAPEGVADAQKPEPSKLMPDEASAALEKLGGRVKVDKNKVAVKVEFPPFSNLTDAGLKHLKGLANLEALFLGRNVEITDAGLIYLKGLTNLKYLDLNFTKVTGAGLVHLKGLKNLEFLALIGTRVTDAGLVHLKGLTNLKELILGVTDVTDAGLIHLEGLTKLKHLNLIATKITPAGVKKLKQALPNCKIAHLGPPEKKPAPEKASAAQGAARKWTSRDGKNSAVAKLLEVDQDGFVILQRADGRTLKLPFSELSQADLEYLKSTSEYKSYLKYRSENEDGSNTSKPTPDEVIAALEKLGGRVKVDKNKAVVSVEIGGTKVTDAGLKHLEGLTELESLSISGAKITDAGLEHLKELTSLKGLFIHYTDVTDAGLVHLKGLTKLEYLDLGFTNVTDAGLVHLKGLTGLKELYLNGTKVTDAGVKKLQQALPNCKIDH